MLVIYEINAIDEDARITAVSIVDRPAVESDFMMFGHQHLQFSEDGKTLLGVLLRPNYLIYRSSPDGGYYIKFTREAIRRICERFLKKEQPVTIMHNGGAIDGVFLTSVFIKDSKHGIAPRGFEDIEEGALFATYSITNPDVLERVKSGELQGFSIEGNFQLTKTNNKMNLLTKLLADVSKLIEVEGGDFIIPEGEDFEEGGAVSYLYSSDAVKDGEYQRGTQKIVIEGEKVKSITEDDAEVDAVVEGEEETPEAPETDGYQEEIEALKAEIEKLKKFVGYTEEPQTQLSANSKKGVLNLIKKLR